MLIALARRESEIGERVSGVSAHGQPGRAEVGDREWVEQGGPTGTRSGCRPLREAIASRTAGWSSTIRILARFLVGFRFMVLPPQSTRYQGAGGLGRLNGQRGANDRRTVLHDA